MWLYRRWAHTENMLLKKTKSCIYCIRWYHLFTTIIIYIYIYIHTLILIEYANLQEHYYFADIEHDRNNGNLYVYMFEHRLVSLQHVWSSKCTRDLCDIPAKSQLVYVQEGWWSRFGVVVLFGWFDDVNKVRFRYLLI